MASSKVLRRRGSWRSTIDVSNFLHRLRRQIRCLVHTSGMHELDLHSGRCSHCKRDWLTLYPPVVTGTKYKKQTHTSRRMIRAILSLRRPRAAL